MMKYRFAWTAGALTLGLIPAVFAAGGTDALTDPGMTQQLSTGSVMRMDDTTGLRSAEQASVFQSFLLDDASANEDIPTLRLASGEAVDARALMSDPCFRAVHEEMDYCMERYGISSDFSTLLEQKAALSGDDATAVLSQEDEEDADDPADADAAASLMQPGNTYDRLHMLWDVCEGSRQGQAGCYQDFLLRVAASTAVDEEELRSVIHDDEDGTNDDDEDEEETDERDADDDIIEFDTDATSDQTNNTRRVRVRTMERTRETIRVDEQSGTDADGQ